jgi:transposase
MDPWFCELRGASSGRMREKRSDAAGRHCRVRFRPYHFHLPGINSSGMADKAANGWRITAR